MRPVPAGHWPRRLFPLLIAFLVLCGCVAEGNATQAVDRGATVRTVPVRVVSQSLQPQAICSGHFITHDLAHVTTTADGVIRKFEANGAGAALGDLDGDGDLDGVLGNYDGANTILWNQGDLHFSLQEMPIGRTRAVSLVDVDADGRLDIVLTRAGGAVNYWRNQGEDEQGEVWFAQEFLNGFGRPAYVIDWADLDGDGDLDAVTASYDAAMLTDQGSAFLLEGGGGVFFHENRDGVFVAEALADEAQALAIALWDVDGDGETDIQIGNDFAVPDYTWLREEGAWRAASPFAQTSFSTMSYDLGDVANHGELALFATDMKPYSTDPAVRAIWSPLMRDLWFSPEEDDPQRQENALLLPAGRGGYVNRAYDQRVDATGWSWSGLFGDLDSDGWLDLTVVNGFIEETVFHYLPNHELVEQTQTLRNRRGSFFERIDWGLDSRYSGRGLAQGDLDGDGDLDMLVNNLRAPAQIFENQICGGDNLLVDLTWADSANPRAIGATVVLETSIGPLRRDVRVTRGYLSSSAGPLHFGLPGNALVERLFVRWPDGAASVVEDGTALLGERLRIERLD